MINSVLYIIPPALSHRTAEENIGVGYIASYLREKGYNVKIIDAWLENLTIEETNCQIEQYLIKTPCLFVGISTYISNINSVIHIVNHIKRKSSIPIIAGGFGPSFFIEDFLKIGVDFISIGEGEISNYEFCLFAQNKCKLEDVSNIAYYGYDNSIIFNKRIELIKDLDMLPFPARDTMNYAVQRKSSVNILSARGCMGHCDFCSVIAFQKLSKGKIWRERSIKNFVDEIEYLYQKGITFFKVIDDSFIEYPRDAFWCKRLADELEGRNIRARFRGSLIADIVSDDILYHLKRAGFFSFACGIESFAPTALKRFGKRATQQANCRALDLFQKNNLYIQCGLILFDPYTTIDELGVNLYYLKKYTWIITKGIFTELYAAEGTVFTNKLLLDNNGTLKRFNENYKYYIKDKNVNNIYQALKKWHKYHAPIYDLVIDPLTAPKNISPSSMKALYELYLIIHTIDLSVLDDLISIYSQPIEFMLKLIEEKIVLYEGKYKEIQEIALSVYHQEQIIYDGDLNKYL